MLKRNKKKTGIETPEFRKPTSPPPPPTSGSNAHKPNPNYVPPASVREFCTYETPCGWCTKWDKKCDKKIGCDNDKPQRGLRAKAGIFLDEAIPNSDAQKVIETVKSGKLPPLNTNNTYGLEKRK